MQERDDASVLPQRVDGRVHAIVDSKPEYALLFAIVAAHVHGARHLFQVRAGGGSEAGREGIVREDGVSKGRACGGCGRLFFRLLAALERDFEAQVRDYLVCGFAAIGGAKGCQRFDLGHC